MRRRILPVSVVFAFALAACAPSAGDAAGPALLGDWTITEIDGTPTPDGVDVSARFSEDGRVGGASGCNTYGGEYAYKGAVLTISQVAQTEMACMDDRRMETETKFHKRFSGALDVAAGPDGALVLSDEEGRIVMRRRAS